MNESEVFQKEIKKLEAELAAKKQQLETRQTPEKEVFSGVLREHIRPEMEQSGDALPSFGSEAQSTPEVAAPSGESDAEAQQYVEALVKHSFQKGILSAVKEARKTGNAAIIDSFHDTLVDHYYQKLLDSRQLKQAD